jgi:hypothetical protein
VVAAVAMSVLPSTASRTDQLANGSTTQFFFNFRAQDTTQVRVYVNSVEQIAGVAKVVNANQDSSPGGSVTFNSAPTNGRVVRIERVVSITQDSVWQPFSAFKAKTLEGVLDKGVMQMQQVQRAFEDFATAQSTRDAAQDALLAAGAVGSSDTMVLATGSTQARPLKDRFEINILDYGATPDDGTDDTAAIRTALAAGAGKRVLIPKGTFLVAPTGGDTAIFRVETRTTVEGLAGAASVLKIKDGAGDFNQVFNGTGTTPYEDVAFRNFRIDWNPVGNAGADVRAVGTATKQQGIGLFPADRLTVEGMWFWPTCAVQAISAGGDGMQQAMVRNNRFKFQMCHTLEPAGWYDNSQVYIETREHVVSGNIFIADLSARALGAIETHGARSTITGNVTDGFATLANIVPMQTVYTDATPNQFVVSDNSVSNAWQGIRFWSITGRSIKGAVITGNAIHIANADRAVGGWLPGVDDMTGIGFRDDGVAPLDLDGDIEDVVINENVITYQPEERVYSPSSYNAGVSLYARGNLRDIEVSHNIIRDAPSQGIRIQSTKTGNTAARIWITDNRIVDAGNDSLAGLRTAIITAGAVDELLIARNQILDTGTGALNGLYPMLFTHTSGSNVRIQDNIIRSAFTAAWNPSLGSAPGLSFGGRTQATSFARVTPTFGSTITVNAHLGNEFVITTGGTSAFTLSAPAAPTVGQRITIRIKNTAGVMGAITWDPVFKMAGWVNPANGKNSSMDFQYDGTNWIQASAQTPDVPN